MVVYATGFFLCPKQLNNRLNRILCHDLRRGESEITPLKRGRNAIQDNRQDSMTAKWPYLPTPVGGITGDATFVRTIYENGGIVLSANNERVRLKIRLTEEEKAKLEHDAALCGLTQAEYFRNVWASGIKGWIFTTTPCICGSTTLLIVSISGNSGIIITSTLRSGGCRTCVHRTHCALSC